MMHSIKYLCCFQPASDGYPSLRDNVHGTHKGKDVRGAQCTPLLPQTTAGHPHSFAALSENYILKACQPWEMVTYLGRRSNGLNDVLPQNLAHDSIQSLEPQERKRLDTFISSPSKPFIIMENLRQGLNEKTLFELDIKIGFKTASKKELIEQSHPSPFMKRQKHRCLDIAYQSTNRGWRIEGITIKGHRLKHPKLYFSLFPVHFLHNFMSKLPPEKQLLILAKVEKITEKLKCYTGDLIGPSILIVTDLGKNSPCRAHLIDCAHGSLRKKAQIPYPEVANAAAQFHTTFKSMSTGNLPPYDNEKIRVTQRSQLLTSRM